MIEFYKTLISLNRTHPYNGSCTDTSKGVLPLFETLKTTSLQCVKRRESRVDEGRWRGYRNPCEFLLREVPVHEMSELYPPGLSLDSRLPTSDQFTVTSVNGEVGMGVQSKLAFKRGSLVARFTGQLSNQIMQHSLQVSPDAHLHDPWFVGLLTHSCSPNAVLDMQRLEIWALSDIEPGDLVTIDYAVTEDTLHRQFGCGCGSASCRKWITGRREPVNATGMAYLQGLAAKKIKRIVLRQPRRGVR